jgi:zinc protease
MRRLFPAFLLLLAFALLMPGPALAKKKKKGRKGKAAPIAEPTPQEKPPSMFEHVSSTPFVGNLSLERYRLPSNQLDVLLIPDDSADTIAYHTYFDVGSGDEVPGKTGLAHLFEHMMFKRTDKYDDKHFSKTLEEAGGPDLNAWTWLDITAYHVSLPKDKLPLIVDLEATRMDGLQIGEDELKAEIEVVRNERRYRVDNSPEGAMDEKLWSTAFTTNRYSWPTIGWDVDIQGYTVEDCLSFYKSYYAPNNATVVLAGSFDTDEALALIEAAYGAIPASDLQRLPHGDEPEQTEARHVAFEQPVEVEMFQLGYKVPELTHGDAPALAVLDSILTAGDSSRLQRRLVDTGVAASVGAYLPPFQHEALYAFSGTLRSGKSAETAMAVVRAEVADLQENLVGDEELSRARNQVLSMSYGELLSNSGRAGLAGFYEVAAGDWQYGLKRIEGYRTVTAEDVQRVAKTWLTDVRSTSIVAHPKGKKPLAHKGKLPKAPASDEALLPVVDRPLEGEPPWPVGEVTMKSKLGWTRMMVPDPTVPMVFFRFVLPNGASRDPEGKEGLANITAELLMRGTQERSRDVFERTLEGLGASVSAGVGSDSVTLSGSVLSENWPKVATLLSEALQYPAWDEQGLKDLIEEVKADIVEARNHDRGLGRRFFNQGLYAGHPYARPVLGTTKSLDSITREDVQGFYRDWFASQGAIAALLGDFDAGAGSDLSKVMGKLEGNRTDVEIRTNPSAPEGRTLWLIDKPERTQVQMHLGHLYRRPEGPEYAAAWVANEAFGGYGFGTRMMSEIREARGWSYGAYSPWSHFKDFSAWNMWVFPATKDAIPALTLMLEMLEALVADGITEDELNYARSSIVNSSAFYVDTPAKRLSYEVRKKRTGYDPLSLVPLVGEVTLEQANAAAASEYHPDALFGTIVGTAGASVPGSEEGSETTLIEALRALVGEDRVEVVPFDRE